MALENNSGILTWNLDPWDSGSCIPNPEANASSFEFVLDSACERLWEKQVEFSIRRINVMKEKLDVMERELDEFIIKSVSGRRSASDRCGNE